MSARAILGQDDEHDVFGVIDLDDARAEGAGEFRERCRAILTSRAAEGRMAQAAVLALDTDLPAEDALAVLAICATDARAAEIPGLTIDGQAAVEAWLHHLRRPT